MCLSPFFSGGFKSMSSFFELTAEREGKNSHAGLLPPISHLGKLDLQFVFFINFLRKLASPLFSLI